MEKGRGCEKKKGRAKKKKYLESLNVQEVGLQTREAHSEFIVSNS